MVGYHPEIIPGGSWARWVVCIAGEGDDQRGIAVRVARVLDGIQREHPDLRSTGIGRHHRRT